MRVNDGRVRPTMGEVVGDLGELVTRTALVAAVASTVTLWLLLPIFELVLGLATR